MKSKAGKVPWSWHPLVGVVIGPVLALAYIAVEKRVTPWALLMFGAWWSWLKLLLFHGFLGWFVKVMLWRRFPSHFYIESMTPEEFAGATPAAVQLQKQRSAARLPLPEIIPLPAAPVEKDDKPDLSLDFERLDARSVQLEALGFKMLAEGALRANSHKIPIFARFFGHEAGHFVELSQNFVPGARQPLVTTFSTRFSGQWLVGDSTQSSQWALWFVRRQRALSKRHEPETATATLWQSHRERCHYVSQHLAEPVERLSFNEYINAAIDDLKEMRPLLLKRSLWWSILSYQLLRPRNGEWWGEFPRDALKRDALKSKP